MRSDIHPNTNARTQTKTALFGTFAYLYIGKSAVCLYENSEVYIECTEITIATNDCGRK